MVYEAFGDFIGIDIGGDIRKIESVAGVAGTGGVGGVAFFEFDMLLFEAEDEDGFIAGELLDDGDEGGVDRGGGIFVDGLGQQCEIEDTEGVFVFDIFEAVKDGAGDSDGSGAAALRGDGGFDEFDDIA